MQSSLQVLQKQVETVNTTLDAATASALLALRPTSINKNLRMNPVDAWSRGQANRIDEYLGTLPMYTGVCYRGVYTKHMPASLVLGWNKVDGVYADEGFTTASLVSQVT